MNPKDLIKKIDEKIDQLEKEEKEENPIELLRRALIKKEIISKDTVLNQEESERLFSLLEKELKNKKG